MREHSKGPWVLEQGENCCGEPMLTIRSADGDILVCDEPYYPTAPENPADFHLISAAPELLMALQAVRSLLSAFIGPDDELGQANIRFADEAIKKAEGKS